jgi:adenosyl cobinamide kinase/adenosyl cobinamide phosphate guanylyltransferase
MHLIIGGAYMGKLEFASETWSLGPEEIFDCREGEPDFSRRCIYHLEDFARECQDPVAWFRERKETWQDCILICGDISGGIVPMSREDRQWREKTGHLCQYLSREADRVSRIFCGLEQRLK